MTASETTGEALAGIISNPKSKLPGAALEITLHAPSSTSVMAFAIPRIHVVGPWVEPIGDRHVTIASLNNRRGFLSDAGKTKARRILSR